MSGLNFSRFAPLPLDYVAAARSTEIDFFEYAVLSILVGEAKEGGDSGVVHTSAAALSSRWISLNKKTAQRVLARLEEGGLIRRFIHPGDSGPFPVAIHGYIKQDGKVQRRLDAARTSDWRNPVFVNTSPPANGSGEGIGQATGERSDEATPLLCREEEVEDPRAAAEAPPDADAPDGGDRNAEPSKRTKPSRPKSKPSRAGAAPTGPLIELWRRLKSEKGIPKEPRYGRHAKEFADLYVKSGEDAGRCAAAITAFFEDHDPHLVRCGWSIGAFSGRGDGYLAACAAPPPPPQSAPRPVQSDEPPASNKAASTSAAAAREALRKGKAKT